LVRFLFGWKARIDFDLQLESLSRHATPFQGPVGKTTGDDHEISGRQLQNDVNSRVIQDVHIWQRVSERSLVVGDGAAQACGARFGLRCLFVSRGLI
jgi:hypothetical protein